MIFEAYFQEVFNNILQVAYFKKLLPQRTIKFLQMIYI
jgi:hypothetical protein